MKTTTFKTVPVNEKHAGYKYFCICNHNGREIKLYGRVYSVLGGRKDIYFCEDGQIDPQVTYVLEEMEQQATNKSLDEFLNAVDRILELHSAEQEGIPTPKMWIEAVNNLSEARENFKQPHPQDSSSGEVAKNYADGKLGKNPSNHKFTFYGTDLRKIIEDAVNHGLGLKPSTPASESLEQAAEKAVFNFLGYVQNGAGVEKFKKLLIDFAKQQQKPMGLVLPETKKVIDPNDLKDKIYCGGWNDCLTELKHLMSAANGVDLEKLLEWMLRHEFKPGFEPDPFFWSKDFINPTIKKHVRFTPKMLVKKFTEQSQQQN